jgi:hypothetical protein
LRVLRPTRLGTAAWSETSTRIFGRWVRGMRGQVVHCVGVGLAQGPLTDGAQFLRP